MAAVREKLKITIDQDSGIPLWVQLRNRLVYLIESGALQPGEKLPTVREMAVAIGINYNTVSKVYQDIERDGFIVSRRGKGTFVAQRSFMDDAPIKTEADVLADDLIQHCLEIGMSFEDIPALLNRRIEMYGKNSKGL